MRGYVYGGLHAPLWLPGAAVSWARAFGPALLGRMQKIRSFTAHRCLRHQELCGCGPTVVGGQHVDHPPRRADDDLRSSLQLRDLEESASRCDGEWEITQQYQRVSFRSFDFIVCVCLNMSFKILEDQQQDANYKSTDYGLSRVAEWEVKYPTPTFQISDSDSSAWREWNFAVKINGNRGTRQEISVSTKVSKEFVPFQQEFRI